MVHLTDRCANPFQCQGEPDLAAGIAQTGTKNDRSVGSTVSIFELVTN